jgi:hypothetical protein
MPDSPDPRIPLSPNELTAGTTICVHIPHGSDSSGEHIEMEIQELARQKGKSAAVSRPAGIERVDTRWREQTCVNWLCRAAGIPREQAVTIIAGLDVRVADKLVFNAGSPRSLLGIAATLLQQPEVFIYSTTALDLDGCRRVHSFVQARCKHLCVVHVSYSSVYGDGSPHHRICPPGGRCVTIIVGS